MNVHERTLVLAATTVDFEISPDERDELDRHLAGCAGCRADSAGIRVDAEVIGGLPMLRRDHAQATGPTVVGVPWRALRLAMVSALVAVLVGLAVFAGAEVVQRWNNIVPPPIPSGTASPAVPTQPLPTAPAPTAATPAWAVQRLDVSALNGEAFTSGLAYANDRFVAVGGLDCDGLHPTACWGSVWTSSDGLSWARLDRSPALAVTTLMPTSGPEPGLLDVAGGPGGFVAIGYGMDGAAVWHSADGLAWDLAPSADAFHDARIHAVAATPAGWTIVGEVFVGTLRTGTPRAAIWTSTDGLGWERVPDGPMFDIGGYFDTMEEPTSGGIEDVASDGTTVVAVGDSCDEEGMSCVQATWRSSDGLTWKRLADGRAGALTSVAGSPLGFVAAGHECEGTSSDCNDVTSQVLKHSADGLAWATVQTPTLDGRLGPVAAGQGFFTVLCQPELSGTLRMAASSDGLHWDLVPEWEPRPIWARGVGMAGDPAGRVVLLGWSETPDGFGSFGAVIAMGR